MLFNSLTFLFFFTIIYALYIGLKSSYKAQNKLLLIGSYVFYGAWNWKFLGLIAASTLVDFYIGKYLHQSQVEANRKRLLWCSIFFNLSVLAFFKYFNFFIDSFEKLVASIGCQADFITLQVILPVGISFYTFQTMSYTIDVYRKKLKPVQDFWDFALFVSFFPQLVAGPIERAANLLPQIQQARHLNITQIHTGLYLIIWGLFKKMVMADNLAAIVNPIFNNYEAYSGLDLGIAVFAFAFQIYGDFSGYTDIARGISKLLGFELMLNFRLPYFALNPSDFWQRWHISLSSWLRDYLYIPLGGNRDGRYLTYHNLLYTMLLGGLWHGAAWNFVIWGIYHGLLLILYKMWRDFFKRLNNFKLDEVIGILKIPSILSSVQMLLMFFFTLIGWLVFRAESLTQITYFFQQFSFEHSSQTTIFIQQVLFFICPVLLLQIWQGRSNNLLIILEQKHWQLGVFYAFLFISILIFGVREATEFIYFQF